MKIAAILNAHETEILSDTVESIQTYLTSDVLVVVDGSKKTVFDNVDMPVHRVEGFIHGQPKSPHRNTALGLLKAHQLWPTADWYVYLEYDCLLGSHKFRLDLEAAPSNIWCIGNDYRICTDIQMDLIELLLKTRFDNTRYLLGCCISMRREFISKLSEIDFFNRFLWYTNSFAGSFFPYFNGFDLSEYLYPTLAAHFGGCIKQLARFRSETGVWEGDGKYLLRWRPDLDENVHPYQDAAVLHPLKSLDHPIRMYHRLKRKNHVR